MQLQEISMEIIRKCPNNCVHCSSFSSLSCKEIIPYEIVRNVIDDAKKIGLHTLCLSGGESFLHPDIYKIIEYAYSSGVDVCVYTSGIYWQNGSARSIPFELLNKIRSKIVKLIFNFEGSCEKTYDAIMGTKGCFPLFINSIHMATDLGIVCEAHFVPMKYNYMEIKSTIDLCQRIGISRISFLRLVPHGRAEINRAQILLNQTE